MSTNYTRPEAERTYVFQTDADIINEVYQNDRNYLIELDDNSQSEYCILYFSSNNIYFPNTKEVFTDQIIKKNKYEWYGNRISNGHKHIFLRDIMKQWYLTGVNASLSSPEKLLGFLKKETKGYKVITIGSSAGGYAAVLFGQLLNAIRIYTFNGRFEIWSRLANSCENIDPIVFRNKNNSAMKQYFDIKNFMVDPSTVFYFYSSKSKLDIVQYEHIKNWEINILSFNTAHHGIPFLKCNLSAVLHMHENKLLKKAGSNIHPLSFSLSNVGLVDTVKGIYSQLRNRS